MEEKSSRAVLIEAVRRNSALDIPHTLMNVLAASIASYGLLADSTAVVIGAMIVAMLLNPIRGVSMGLAESDHSLIYKAGISLLGGFAAVFIAAYIIGLANQEVPITGHITARTAPSFFDLVIALAGGVAGAYATVSPDLSVAFVGVAVATALVPPLSSCAILLARGDTKMADGALLLTFTNIVAIQLSSSVVFWLSPDLTIVDISLKGSSGLELIKHITALSIGLPALVLPMHDETLYAERALRAGASGYITKHQTADKVLSAMRRALGGRYPTFRDDDFGILEEPNGHWRYFGDRTLDYRLVLGPAEYH